jgi:hypothetical protein
MGAPAFARTMGGQGVLLLLASRASASSVAPLATEDAPDHHERRQLCHGSCTSGYSVQLDPNYPAWQMCCFSDWNRPDANARGATGGCNAISTLSSSSSDFISLNPTYADQIQVGMATVCCGTPFGQDPSGGLCSDLAWDPASPPAPPAAPWDSCISLNFEDQTEGQCPQGWKCSDAAAVDLGEYSMVSGLRGKKLFALGQSPTSAADWGDATSAVFRIPIGATAVKYKRTGG